MCILVIQQGADAMRVTVELNILAPALYTDTGLLQDDNPCLKRTLWLGIMVNTLGLQNAACVRQMLIVHASLNTALTLL